MAKAICRACGHENPFTRPFAREAACEQCGRDFRACRNCRHFDEHCNNQCKETEADLVSDKDRRNFCEYFEPSQAAFAAGGTKDRAAEARAKLDALFRKPDADH